MNSFDSKLRKPEPLDSVFSLIKVTTRQKPVILTLNIFNQCFEFFLFQAKLFYFSSKKIYLFQVFSLNKAQNVFFWTDFFLLFKKIKGNPNSLLLFLNLPFFFSNFFSQVVESIGKKTVYIYRFLLLLTLPSLFFYVNNTFLINSKKDSLFFLLHQRKKQIFVTSQDSFYLLQIKKSFLPNSTFNELFENLKRRNTTQKNSFSQPENLYYFPMSLRQNWKNFQLTHVLSSSPFFLDHSFSSSKISKLSNNTKFFSKWFTSYFYLKKNYSPTFENATSTLLKKEVHLTKTKFSSFHLFSKKTNRILFGFLNCEDLTQIKNYLLKKEGFPINLEFQKQQIEANLHFLKSSNFDFQQQRKSKKNTLSYSKYKRQWSQKIQSWKQFSCSEYKTSFLENNKFSINRTFNFLQDLKLVVQVFLTFWKKVLERSLLNRSSFWFSWFQQNEPFQFRSYKNAINYTTFPFSLSDKIGNLQNLAFFNKKLVKPNLFEKINFLYNYSQQLGDGSVLMTPEAWCFLQNTTQKPHESLSFLVQNRSLYNLDFFWKNYKVNGTIFDSSNSYWEKLNSENEKNKTNFKRILSFSTKKKNSPFLEQDTNFLSQKREKLKKTFFLKRSHSLTNYTKWFFTSQWWLFRKQEFSIQLSLFFDNVQTLKRVFLIDFFTKLNNVYQKHSDVNQKLKKFTPLQFLSEFYWKIFFVEPLDIIIAEQSFWEQQRIFFSFKNISWIFFAWSSVSSLIYYHSIPLLSGIVYLFLWLDFERIRSISYPSWKTFLDILVYTSNESSSQEVRLATYSSRTRVFSLYSTSSKFLTMFFSSIAKWNQLTTSDLSRTNKNLVSNCLITKNTLKTKYSFWNLNQQHEHLALNASGFFQKWCTQNNRSVFFLQKNQTKSFSFNQINDLLFYSQHFIFSLPYFVNKNNFGIKSKPTLLIDSLVDTQRWLFIGSVESGKSHAIKNIAASLNYPLIYISLKDIKNATLDIKYSKIKKQKRWLEQLSERSFFLENVFTLAKMVSPSVLWVADLHQFDAKNQIQDKNTQKFDLSLLMAILLKILSIDLLPEKQNSITFIASTEYPKLLDPKFVSRQRLDLIVNFRTPSSNQRQLLFHSLLRNKGFSIQGLHSAYELSSNTLGYTFQDIINLVNETLLVKTTENSSFVNSKNIRLALYRKTSTQCVQSRIVRQDILYYKIGKAIVQSILVSPKSIVFLSKYQDLWKTKFYYLSNTFLEPSTRKTAITEFVMFLQLVKFLAGAASQDAGLVFQQNWKQNSLALTNQLKHDFSLASTILQSLLVEFPMRNFQLKKSDQTNFFFRILKTFDFQNLQRASSSLEFFEQSPTYLHWNNKGNRLSFNWFLLFGGLEQSSNYVTRAPLLEKNKEGTFSNLFNNNFDTNLPYERREIKRQQQKIQKTDLLFTKMLWNIYTENLGFPWESEHIMNYNPFQVSLFFREARPLWNPRTQLPSYSLLFFDRDLLINQKLLTKLYLTYGTKFQAEKLTRKRIKKQFLWSNTTFVKEDSTSKTNLNNDFGKDHFKDFYMYQNISNLNSFLIQSQLQLPVYFHQGWITEDASETFRLFNNSNSNLFNKNIQSCLKESSVFEILLEVYSYLFVFFLNNRNNVEKIKDTLLKKDALYWRDIESCIKKNS